MSVACDSAARGQRGMTFGAFIRQRRKGLGRRQRWVAAQAMLSAQFLSDLETDKMKRPSPEVLRRLAVILGCPYEQLAAELVADVAERYGLDRDVVRWRRPARRRARS